MALLSRGFRIQDQEVDRGKFRKSDLFAVVRSLETVLSSAPSPAEVLSRTILSILVQNLRGERAVDPKP